MRNIIKKINRLIIMCVECITSRWQVIMLEMMEDFHTEIVSYVTNKNELGTKSYQEYEIINNIS